MMLNFSESGHPVFRGSSALERRDFKSKGKGHLSFSLLCGDDKNRVIGSSHDHLRRSVQNPRNGSGHVRRIGSQNLCLFRTYREICCVVIPTELTTTNKSLRAECFTTVDDTELVN